MAGPDRVLGYGSHCIDADDVAAVLDMMLRAFMATGDPGEVERAAQLLEIRARALRRLMDEQ